MTSENSDSCLPFETTEQASSRQLISSPINLLIGFVTLLLHIASLSSPGLAGADSISVSAKKNAELHSANRRVIWGNKWGFSYEYHTCWHEEIKSGEFPKPVGPLYTPGKSCPNEEQGNWSIRPMYSMYSIRPPHVGYLAGAGPQKLPDYNYDPSAASFKVEREINGVHFDFYQACSADRTSQCDWVAVASDDQQHQISPTYVNFGSKKFNPNSDIHAIPKVFLDFVSSIRIKTLSEFDAREKKGHMKNFEKITGTE